MSDTTCQQRLPGYGICPMCRQNDPPNSARERGINCCTICGACGKRTKSFLWKAQICGLPLDANGLCEKHRYQRIEKPQRPKIICICGSSRFADHAAVASWNFSKQGFITVSYELLPEWYHEKSGKVARDHYAEQEGVANILDELHLRKIDLADEVFVINVGGYIGDRTKIEIAYANRQRKPVNYLERPQ